MKIDMKIGDIECHVETDYQPTTVGETGELARAAAFSRLCNEAKSVAYKLIDAKYGTHQQKGDN